jgi:hypothetical protein
VPLARQLTHQRFVRPGPLVLGTALLKSPTPTEDRDRHVCYLRVALSPPGGQVVSVPPGSPCRHGGRTISSRARARVRRMASEDSGRPMVIQPFLLIVRRGPDGPPTCRVVTSTFTGALRFRLSRGTAGCIRRFQHLAGFKDSAVVHCLTRVTPHYCGHRLYLHPISGGRRVMDLVDCRMAGDPSPWSSETREVVTGANTPMLRRCRSTSTAEIRFVFE